MDVGGSELSVLNKTVLVSDCIVWVNVLEELEVDTEKLLVVMSLITVVPASVFGAVGIVDKYVTVVLSVDNRSVIDSVFVAADDILSVVDIGNVEYVELEDRISGTVEVENKASLVEESTKIVEDLSDVEDSIKVLVVIGPDCVDIYILVNSSLVDASAVEDVTGISVEPVVTTVDPVSVEGFVSFSIDDVSSVYVVIPETDNEVVNILEDIVSTLVETIFVMSVLVVSETEMLAESVLVMSVKVVSGVDTLGETVPETDTLAESVPVVSVIVVSETDMLEPSVLDDVIVAVETKVLIPSLVKSVTVVSSIVDDCDGNT